MCIREWEGISRLKSRFRRLIGSWVLLSGLEIKKTVHIGVRCSHIVTGGKDITWSRAGRGFLREGLC